MIEYSKEKRTKTKVGTHKKLIETTETETNRTVWLKLTDTP